MKDPNEITRIVEDYMKAFEAAKAKSQAQAKARKVSSGCFAK